MGEHVGAVKYVRGAYGTGSTTTSVPASVDLVQVRVYQVLVMIKWATCYEVTVLIHAMRIYHLASSYTKVKSV